MTAEPDALRLVPVEPTEEMIEAGNRALSPWVAPAMHAGDAYYAMLAAAPAVQPAAGREEISDEAILKAATEIRESSVAWANEPDHFAHLIELTPAEVRKLIAALSQPGPASEGDAR